MYDMIEGTSNDGLLSTGASWRSWGSASNYTDVVFAHVAARRVHDHVTTHTTAAGPSAASPMYLHLAFHGPHDDPGVDSGTDEPLLQTAFSSRLGVASKKALDALAADEADNRRRYQFGRSLMATDGAFGQVVNAMNDSGILDAGAVIIVASDNGAWPCGSRMRGSNAPLRGAKFHYTEGALRVPGFVYSSGSGAATSLIPSASRGRAYRGLMHHVDWLTTFASLAGASVDDDPALDSIDQWQAIVSVDAVPSPRDEIVFALSDDYFAIRVGRYKLTLNVLNSTWWGDLDVSKNDSMVCVNGNAVSELHDVEADPNERRNLFGMDAYAEVQANLSSRARELYKTELYTPSMPFGSAMADGTNGEAASHAFDSADGYIVSWGCEVQ